MLGGAETFLMKIYRNIDKEKYQFDFIVSVKEKGFYNDEIESLDGRIYYDRNALKQSEWSKFSYITFSEK